MPEKFSWWWIHVNTVLIMVWYDTQYLPKILLSRLLQNFAVNFWRKPLMSLLPYTSPGIFRIPLNREVLSVSWDVVSTAMWSKWEFKINNPIKLSPTGITRIWELKNLCHWRLQRIVRLVALLSHECTRPWQHLQRGSMLKAVDGLYIVFRVQTKHRFSNATASVLCQF